MDSDFKILIVEDELVLQMMLEHMLKKMGFNQFDTATKGKTAIEKCDEQEFDLILMDIMLQDQIDGIEAYRQISKKKKIPVIYITGNTDPRNKERAQEIGFHDYIGKPITMSYLKSSINKLVPSD
ncbi:MAG: response regulator [Balneolaceae bacterium]|nr:response regulator [Balneolaceae bacterium]